MEPTAGPWIKSKSGTEITTADGVSIALVSTRPLEWDANSDLLAAAPDLLAALLLAADWTDYMPTHVHVAIAAAIAKAKGSTL